MRIATLAGLACTVFALSGCGMADYMSSSKPGASVEFVSSSADAVLLDFAARPIGELSAADATADQQCQMFHRRGATRETLTVRRDGLIRATYVCRR